jgi:hypothetical protein
VDRPEFEVMHGVFTPKIGEGHVVIDDASLAQ